MAQLHEVELAIGTKPGQEVGRLIVKLLPRARVDGIWPLADERANRDRDTSLESGQLLESHEYVYELCLDAPTKNAETHQPARMFPDGDVGIGGRLHA